MAIELVDILFQDIALPNPPVAGVLVHVYDQTGTTLITTGTTDGTGHVTVLLPGTAAPAPTRYQLRTFKAGTSTSQPKYIDVFSPPAGSPTGTNNFKISLSVFTHPPAPDPNLCRLSGYIRDPGGRYVRGVDIHFIHRFNPLVVGEELVLGERITQRTDSSGYFQVDLWRKGCYRAIIQSHENAGRDVYVPDLASANIATVLFPRVYSVEYTPAAPWSLAVGTELSIAVKVTLTSGFVIDGTASEDVLYSLPADDITASLQVLNDRIILRGANPGTTSVRLARVDNSLAYDPNDPIVGDGATFTVV